MVQFTFITLMLRSIQIERQIEIERLAVLNVVLCGKQRAHKLSTKRFAVSVLESPQTKLLVRHHLCIDQQQLRRERVIIIECVDVC